jgi:hypothetical protein
MLKIRAYSLRRTKETRIFMPGLNEGTEEQTYAVR